MKKQTFGLLLFIAISSQLLAQNLITNEIISRVVNIKYENKRASGFIIEQNSKSYIITAKHLFGEKFNHKSNVVVQILQDSVWKYLGGKVLVHTNPQIDIALIETQIKISTPNQFELSTDNALYGDQGYFLGFPYDFKMDDKNGFNAGFPIPFIKNVIISAIINQNGATVLYLDGHNNPGFSGGPVVFKNRTGKSKHKWNIIGVISAYYAQENIINTIDGPLKYTENSGIVVAYGIDHVFEIINRK